MTTPDHVDASNSCSRPQAQVSEEQKELIKTLVEEKNARDLECKQSCMAIEAPPVDDADYGPVYAPRADSGSFACITLTNTPIEGTSTPRAVSLFVPDPVTEPSGTLTGPIT